MAVINTNVNALIARNAGTVNDRSLTNAMQQLSTGKRINSAADDAAGLAISNKMTSAIRGLDQAVRNANDSISMLQVAEGATVEMTNMLQRMRELAVASASDTNGSAERSYLNDEFTALQAEIDRIGGNTQWNGTNLTDGTIGNGSGAVTFQVGANASQTIGFTFNELKSDTATGKMSAISGDSISVQTAANAAISNLDSAIKALNGERSSMGAMINRLTYAADSLANTSVNQAAARSRILDADYASTTTELARTQIIQQASTAMLAQANQQAQSVLSLLK
jgi:flagellin